jgi:hypothetical protein
MSMFWQYTIDTHCGVFMVDALATGVIHIFAGI